MEIACHRVSSTFFIHEERSSVLVHFFWLGGKIRGNMRGAANVIVICIAIQNVVEKASPGRQTIMSELHQKPNEQTSNFILF